MEAGRVTDRSTIPSCKRILIKVGSSLIVDGEGHLNVGFFGNLIDQIGRLVRNEKKEIILVSSGSIALGKQIFKEQQRERKHTDRECAAAGQMKIMALYHYLFGLKGLPSSQILLANDDFFVDERRNNLKGTIDNLLHHGIVPVLNENDVTSHNNGNSMMLLDNDSLATLIAVTLDVEITILLTDVDGLHKFPPNTNVANNPVIHTYSCDDVLDLNGKSNVGRGGMSSKINAAMMAVGSQNDHVKGVVIANGTKYNIIEAVTRGETVGTLFTRECVKKENKQKENSFTPKQMAIESKEASRVLQALSAEERSMIMNEVATRLTQRSTEILEANKLDIIDYERQTDYSTSLRDRLRLSQSKLETLASGIRSLAASTKENNPLGRVVKSTELANGLILHQTTAPIGVILVIFESRPDSLPQICLLSFLSGNGLLLKGGKEAARSNKILHSIIVDTIYEKSQGKVSKSIIGLIEDRATIKDLLKLDKDVTLVIPRGSSELVEEIQKNTKIPVLGHSEGICHVYLHSDADIQKAIKITLDSKTDYPAACNATETLLIHKDLLLNGVADSVMTSLKNAKVVLMGGPRASTIFSIPPVKSLKTEYNELKITIEIVDDISEAIAHINQYGSSHTDCIVTESDSVAERFLNEVDSACVFYNASTRFADGYRFGLGAEVGISTGRIHARGPVGIEGLLCMKWKLISKKGHIVGDFSKNIEKYTHRELQPIPLTSKL